MIEKDSPLNNLSFYVSLLHNFHMLLSGISLQQVPKKFNFQKYIKPIA